MCNNHYCKPQLRCRAPPNASMKLPLLAMTRHLTTLGWRNRQWRHVRSLECGTHKWGDKWAFFSPPTLVVFCVCLAHKFHETSKGHDSKKNYNEKFFSNLLIWERKIKLVGSTNYFKNFSTPLYNQTSTAHTLHQSSVPLLSLIHLNITKLALGLLFIFTIHFLGI